MVTYVAPRLPYLIVKCVPKWWCGEAATFDTPRRIVVNTISAFTNTDRRLDNAGCCF